MRLIFQGGIVVHSRIFLLPLRIIWQVKPHSTGAQRARAVAGILVRVTSDVFSDSWYKVKSEPDDSKDPS